MLVSALTVIAGAFALIEQLRLESARCPIGAAGINLNPPHVTEGTAKANGKS